MRIQSPFMYVRSHRKINAYSLNPGPVFTNMIQKEDTAAGFKVSGGGPGVIDEDGTPNTEKYDWKTLQEGAATTLVAAFDPILSNKPVAYLDDCKVATETVAPHSSDPANASLLLTVTEKVIGQSFEF
ncbi:hypothetical protein DFH07DRAFT_90867 [Mycena maculata]|uniref:Uncharacterized protein n=1 Tax=Mycena maculata TaxID=230809 RepID=A0AAD7IAS9_9AGAR|nr:hypothetical protein DFH07DRAFT_90867 [Mycena maculata]